MAPRRLWSSLRRWLVWMWEHVPFVRHQRGPGLAGVREPRRPRPPFRPPQAMAAPAARRARVRLPVRLNPAARAASR